MKASKLISFLKDMISNYGDLELITEIEDIFVKNVSAYGTVDSVSFDSGKILISGKTDPATIWVNSLKKMISNKQYIDEDIKDLEGVPYDSQKVIPINRADHYSVFREIDEPKESTGYANYNGREF